MHTSTTNHLPTYLSTNSLTRSLTHSLTHSSPPNTNDLGSISFDWRDNLFVIGPVVYIATIFVGSFMYSTINGWLAYFIIFFGAGELMFSQHFRYPLSSCLPFPSFLFLSFPFLSFPFLSLPFLSSPFPSISRLRSLTSLHKQTLLGIGAGVPNEDNDKSFLFSTILLLVGQSIVTGSFLSLVSFGPLYLDLSLTKLHADFRLDGDYSQAPLHRFGGNQKAKI